MSQTLPKIISIRVPTLYSVCTVMVIEELGPIKFEPHLETLDEWATQEATSKPVDYLIGHIAKYNFGTPVGVLYFKDLAEIKDFDASMMENCKGEYREDDEFVLLFPMMRVEPVDKVFGKKH